ncbi:MAG: alpha/beta hydrolase [Bacteroidota bacterium]
MKQRSSTITFILFFIIFTNRSVTFPELTATPYGLIETDISYSVSQKNSLDLYIPQQQKFPVILFIHGGSFVAGDRKDFPYAQIGEAFQKSGIGCAVMSYRLLQDSVWPAQPRDAAKAIRWLKDHIADYGGDSDKIYIVGHSAGGQLAALICSDSMYVAEFGLSLSDIQGCVSLGAMMSDAGSLQSLTADEEQRLFRNDWFFKIFGSKQNFVNSLPIRHVNASMPKMLLILADAELYDPPKQQSLLEFMAEAKKLYASVEYEILPNRTHMGTVEQMVNISDPAIQKIVSFISK